MAQGCSFLVCLVFLCVSTVSFADDFESVMDVGGDLGPARVTADSENRTVTRDLQRAGTFSNSNAPISGSDRVRFVNEINSQLGFPAKPPTELRNGSNEVIANHPGNVSPAVTGGVAAVSTPNGAARTDSGTRSIPPDRNVTVTTPNGPTATNRSTENFVPGGTLPQDQNFQPGAWGKYSDTVQPNGNGAPSGGDVNIYVQAPPQPTMDLDQWRQYQKAVQAAEIEASSGQDPHTAAAEPEPPSKGMADLIKELTKKPAEEKPSELDKWVDKQNEKTEEVVAEAQAALNDPKMPQEERAKILEKLVQASEGGETDPALEAAKQMAASVLGKRLPGEPTRERFTDKALDPSGRYVGEFVSIRGADPFRASVGGEFFSPDAGTYAADGVGRAPSRSVASYDVPKEGPKKEKEPKGSPKPKATGLPGLAGMPPKTEKPAAALKKISPSLIRELAATMQSQHRLASRWLASAKRGENQVKAGLAAVTAKVSPQLAGLIFDPLEANEEDLPWITLVFLSFGLMSVVAFFRWRRINARA